MGRFALRSAFWRALAAVPLALVLAAAPPRHAGAETMEAALARAYQGNPQLNAQRTIVRQTDEGVSQALSGYRPTLSASAAAGEQFTNLTEVFPPVPGSPFLANGFKFSATGYTTPRSIGVSGQQTLFNGEQTANRVRAAESQVSASRERCG